MVHEPILWSWTTLIWRALPRKRHLLPPLLHEYRSRGRACSGEISARLKNVSRLRVQKRRVPGAAGGSRAHRSMQIAANKRTVHDSLVITPYEALSSDY